MNKYLILLAAMLANIAMLTLASCSDDEADSGTPVIECVRTTDPEKADSTFTEATVGQLILIQGRNLGHATHVYINDQDVYFNSNYNTSTHIIVTIPEKLIVRGMDENVPLEIRVETTHGTATYDFHVIAGVPSLEMYKADLKPNAEGIPEMVPGQEVRLIGKLLHEIEHIYVTDLDTVPLYEVTEYTLNAERTEIVLTMPANEVPDYGIYKVECYAGDAYCGFSKSPMEPELFDISTDMPIPGQQVVIYGKYLTNLTALNLGGEIAIDINGVSETEAMDRLTFTMPETIPGKDSNGLITVTTLGGKATLPFYRYDRIYEDFDGNGTGMNYGWGTGNHCDYPVWGWPAVPDDCPVTVASGYFLYFDGFTSWWDHNQTINGKLAPEGIDPATPLADIEFRYEVWIQQQWSVAETMTSKIKVMGREKGGIAIADRVTGTLLPAQWMSVGIPMTEFAPDLGTWGDLVAADAAGGDNFTIFLEYNNTGDDVKIAYDNFRFYIKD